VHKADENPGRRQAEELSLGLLRFPKRLTADHLQLYDMIFKRFIASQMKEVRLLYQKFSVELDGNRVSMENPISLVSDGFNLVLLVKIANPVEEGEYAVIFGRLLTVPVARPFTQGELIFLMRERGIGRPSTYAKIISTILEGWYAFDRGNRLISTRLGFRVYTYLHRNLKLHL
jgi:reverse gyrase